MSQNENGVFLTISFSHDLNPISDLNQVYDFVILQSMAKEDGSFFTAEPAHLQDRELR